MGNIDFLPKVEDEFSGTGQILCRDGLPAQYEYSFTQKSSGSISVRGDLLPEELERLRIEAREVKSDLEDEDDDWWDGELRHLTFEGRTPGGLELRLTDVDFVTAPGDGRLHFHIAQAAIVNFPDALPSHLVFRLVNFEMPPMPRSTHLLPSGATITGDLLSLHLPTGAAWLRDVEDDYKLVKKLEADGGVAVTVELILPLAKLGDVTAVIETTKRMCCVLTFLSGNRVNWLNYHAINAGGEVLRSGWQNAVTRSYQDTNLLNSISDSKVKLRWGNELYCSVINRMMARFEMQEKKWNLVAVINSWHEAISSEHFAEQQGQLLANCMEMLRQSYLEHGGQEFILPQDEFAIKQTSLVKSVKKLLEQQFPDVQDWTNQQRKEHGSKLSQMSLHVKGANRYGFEHSLHEMARELNLFSQSVVEELQEKPDARGFLPQLHLDVTEQEQIKASESQAGDVLKESVKAFVAIRNRLTHQGRLCVPEVDEQNGWSDCRVNRERMRQERFMERFVGTYLASILGWQQALPTSPLPHIKKADA